jgi:hypothetical protein
MASSIPLFLSLTANSHRVKTMPFSRLPEASHGTKPAYAIGAPPRVVFPLALITNLNNPWISAFRVICPKNHFFHRKCFHKEKAGVILKNERHHKGRVQWRGGEGF